MSTTIPEIAGPAFVSGAAPGKPPAPACAAKVLAHGPDLMLTRVAFEPGARGPGTSTPHAQLELRRERREFAYTIEGETRRPARRRQLLRAAAGLARRDVCHEAGVLVDAFTPRRDDFLR